MTTVEREVERKYDVADEAAVLDAVESLLGTAGVAAVAEGDEHLLDATYYDTADLRLIEAGVTLRRRTGGQDAGWHLKLPAGPDTREEIQLPLAAAAGEVPGELVSSVRSLTRDAPLAPVARIQTSRRLLRLLDDDFQPLAEIAADHVRAEPADGSAATSWAEIEAELVTGDPALLEAIELRVRRAGATRVAATTKLQRALAGRLATAGAGPVPLPSPASPDAGEIVLAYVRDQVAAIRRHDPGVRCDEPDAVHQMRVATRRARSAMQAFGGVLDRDRTRPLGTELKWLAAELGQARDSEVLLDRLTNDLSALPPTLVAGPVRARITAHFDAELARAHEAALAALDGPRYLRLLDDLHAMLADPPLTPLAGRPARKALGGPVRRAARRLQRALDTVPGAEDRDAAIHQARKATKRARYAAEAAVPVLGKLASRQVRRTKELQQLLGDHHDSVVARAVLLDLAQAARTAGEDTFTYGLLYQHEACQAAAIEQSLPSLSHPDSRR